MSDDDAAPMPPMSTRFDAAGNLVDEDLPAVEAVVEDILSIVERVKYETI